MSVLPDCVVREDGADLPIKAMSLGMNGINKSFNPGARRGEEGVAHIAGFRSLAGTTRVASADDQQGMLHSARTLASGMRRWNRCTSHTRPVNAFEWRGLRRL